MENSFIHSFIALPIIGFLLSLIVPNSREQLLSRIAILTVGIQFLSAIIFTAVWVKNGHNIINIKEYSIYSTQGYDFYIDFYFDHITLVYLFLGSILTLIITS